MNEDPYYLTEAEMRQWEEDLEAQDRRDDFDSLILTMPEDESEWKEPMRWAA